ncbi:unnamed protein product [Didymodactylos carnosus]|uniref:Uncharacterized protein n=2 Tax=Didymodactylos carnosus TaxID=1234261 RepID=A0A8S2EG87_9BILA|nr:unnamed protein product [Didymodactylos carnosus]CAF4007606.1 unnamed protein product [Didymodactylos carnosus]
MSGKSEEVLMMFAEFVESARGKRQLCYLGCRYSLKRKNQNGSEYWLWKNLVQYNHYRNITPRTINYLEGRHSRMKKHVSSPHPNIYIAIDLLQKEQSLASIARVRDGMGAPAPKRRRNKVITEECLMKLWQHYDDGRIDIPAFLKAAGMRYFQRPSKS